MSINPTPAAPRQGDRVVRCAAHADEGPRHAGAGLPALDAGFRFLQDAYRLAGGVVRGASLAQRMTLLGAGCHVDLARHLVSRRVFSFRWKDDDWLPMFQFDPVHLVPRPEAGRVLSALLRVGPGGHRLDGDGLQAGSRPWARPGPRSHESEGWALARWFVTPEASLEWLTPLCLIGVETDAVIAAARRRRCV